jgi:hypothetical protein
VTMPLEWQSCATFEPWDKLRFGSMLLKKAFEIYGES